MFGSVLVLFGSGIVYEMKFYVLVSGFIDYEDGFLMSLYKFGYRLYGDGFIIWFYEGSRCCILLRGLDSFGYFKII